MIHAVLGGSRCNQIAGGPEECSSMRNLSGCWSDTSLTPASETSRTRARTRTAAWGGEPSHWPTSSNGAESNVTGGAASCAKPSCGLPARTTPASDKRLRLPIIAGFGIGLPRLLCWLGSVRRQQQRLVLQQIAQVEIAGTFEVDDSAAIW